MTIRLTYAPEVDALAICFAPGALSTETREIAPETFADFDQNGRLLGIEVLNASTFYSGADLEQLPRPGPQPGIPAPGRS